MHSLLRTSLGVAAVFAVATAQAAPLNTGGYVLGSELASPGSFDATFTATEAGTAGLDVELVGFASLDGDGNCCADVFHLSLNGMEVFTASFNLGGGGANTILFNPYGATALTTTYGATDSLHDSHQVTWAGGVSRIALPIGLLVGLNTLTFSYTGLAQGTGDEGWGVGSLGITTSVPEPQTYALLLAGLGAVGLLSRRRRRLVR
jgi:hypothetical protein